MLPIVIATPIEAFELKLKRALRLGNCFQDSLACWNDLLTDAVSRDGCNSISFHAVSTDSLSELLGCANLSAVSGAFRRFLFSVALSSVVYGTPVRSYKVLAKYPHSRESFTEGFFYREGLFYEGVGLNGHSGVRVSVPETGKIIQQIQLPDDYFGEGVVDWGPYLFEWTWTSHVCFVYDRFSLQIVKQFSYSGEGWGMTRTTREVITSDGSPILRFRNPDTFAETHEITVKDGGEPVQRLNELEYIKGQIYANVWHSDRIARISPSDGHVIDWIDLAGLLPADQKVNNESVLNGIAYDPQHDRVFVTGKQWPAVFQIKVVQ